MVTEHVRAHVPVTEWATVSDEAVPATPVDETLIDTVVDLSPGRALDLGCGTGQNAVWLAQRGWAVGGVDIAPGAISEAQAAAEAADVNIIFEVQDITIWRPRKSYDLVISTFALPASGTGRSRMLEAACAAVAPGGTIIISEFDMSLRHEGWMAEKYLVSIEELERHLDGFRVNRSVVRICRHPNGHDQRVLPVATIVATRRTDLRTR
jgi:2-polyprenyl-3-methyl-5-hydroxy-6-metoxy-1,4-benzoquinol methylase